jgi:uncharacterized protein (TIGR03083 family)
MFPGERAYRAERQAFLATIESLSEEELEHGTTLCAEWAPRDIASHLIGIDEALPEYVKAAGNVNKGNARIVARMAALERKELLDRLREWAAKPAITSLMVSYGLHGDLATHHQDVLRGLGRRRDVPPASARAILREGALFGVKKLTSHRVVPTDTGRPLGRGRVVKGTAEQLGLWLAGRRSVEPELVFATEN